jgi:hypothetical protein
MWALVVDGVVDLVRAVLPAEVMDGATCGVAPTMVPYTPEDAAADGWVEVTLSASPGEGFDPLLVVGEDGAVVQTWVET